MQPLRGKIIVAWCCYLNPWLLGWPLSKGPKLTGREACLDVPTGSIAPSGKYVEAKKASKRQYSSVKKMFMGNEKNSFGQHLFSSFSKFRKRSLWVEQAWAWAQLSGANFRLAIVNPLNQAQGYFSKAWARLGSTQEAPTRLMLKNGTFHL